MKKLFKKLKQLEASISLKQNEFRELATSNYYKLISNSNEKAADRREVLEEIKNLQKLKFTVLENLGREIHLAKISTSNAERQINLNQLQYETT